jgi:hypothetical protein
MNKSLWNFRRIFTNTVSVVGLPFGVLAANIPYFPIDTASSEYSRFVAYVDRALGGNPDYGFSPYDAIIRYSMSGKTVYADFAISQVDSLVASEEAAIAAGNQPDVAGDSYLYVGDLISSLALTYDWAFDRLTQSQKTRWKAYADQTIDNIWNPSQASWGGSARPWSGWSISNPGNNYHYSFLKATMYWAVASRNQHWLDFLRTQKTPPLVEYFKLLPGGGSLEGTGYGTSHKSLFDLYGFWKSATGTDLSVQSTHCVNSIDYWVHATMPTLDRFAPIGDQARVSDAPLYDYQRALVEKAVLLNPGTPQAARGMWWLSNISIRRMSSAFNLKDNIAQLPDAPQKPTALLYYSPGVGDLFARTSWDTNATWLHVKAGIYNESHAHQDQGAFSIYNRGWLAVTENINTHSGIEQGTEVHNVLRFQTKNGVDTVSQSQSDSSAAVSFDDNHGVLLIAVDVSKMYRREPRIQGWRRTVIFDRPANTVTIHDTFAIQTTTLAAIWQLNTPVKPEIQGDSIVAGNLVVKALDADAQVKVLQWNAMQPNDASWAAEFPTGWKMELTRPADATTFSVRLRVNAPPTWKLSAVRGRPFGPQAATPVRLDFRKGISPASITLHFTATAAQTLTFRLCDCLGKTVCPDLNRCVEAGSQTLTWNMPNLAAGTYVTFTNVNGIRSTSRIVVAKSPPR